jgi:hypothetical protein
VQLIQDYEDYAEVNTQLEKMGYNIGTRLIEDFLARSSLGRCADFREVGEVVAKVGLHVCTKIIRYADLFSVGWIQVVPECDAVGGTRRAAAVSGRSYTTGPCNHRQLGRLSIRPHSGREPARRVRRAPGGSPRGRPVVQQRPVRRTSWSVGDGTSAWTALALCPVFTHFDV